MNNKGYTLIELMVAIVIIGIIMGMAFPSIRRLQERNTHEKYENYGEALIAATKIYVDSYEEDLFLYEDDLELIDRSGLEGQIVNGQLMEGNAQCVFVSFDDLKNHTLIKDINVEGMTCYSNLTYVRVIRKNGDFKYKYYLACGKKQKKNQTEPIDNDDITFSLPKKDGALPLEGHVNERCRDE